MLMEYAICYADEGGWNRHGMKTEGAPRIYECAPLPLVATELATTAYTGGTPESMAVPKMHQHMLREILEGGVMLFAQVFKQLYPTYIPAPV